MKIILILLFNFSFLFGQQKNSAIFSTSSGEIGFISNAPLETIKATSKQLRGAIDINARTFLFTVNTNTFQGFNSGLQKEHFDENYLETHKYPVAKFDGKLIEEVDLSKPGKYEVRAKGMLELHGVKQERIIKGSIEITETTIHIQSQFSVLLEDHNIKIPRVVYQKISPETLITVDTELKPFTSK